MFNGAHGHPCDHFPTGLIYINTLYIYIIIYIYIYILKLDILYITITKSGYYCQTKTSVTTYHTVGLYLINKHKH